MSATLNIYCDESCHLLNDGHEVMTLGALWCPVERRREISVRLREIKSKHGIPLSTEVKWVMVSSPRPHSIRSGGTNGKNLNATGKTPKLKMAEAAPKGRPR